MRPLFYSFYSLVLLPSFAWADVPTMTRMLKEEAHIGKFQFCNGGTCADVKTVGLGNGEWQRVRDLFNPLPETAEQEREVLRQAIGLLRFHHVEDTETRGGFLIFGRHSTAAIRDIASGKLYAVDSWFFDNGVPAVVLPLEVWQNGWRPADVSVH